MKIDIGDLNKVIADELQNMQGKTIREVTKAARLTANEVKKELLETSPSSSQGGGKKYRTSWTVKRERGSVTQPDSFIVHNKEKGWLTHLLENSRRHYLRNGKFWGIKQGQPHLAPARDKAEAKFLERLGEMDLS